MTVGNQPDLIGQRTGRLHHPLIFSHILFCKILGMNVKVGFTNNVFFAGNRADVHPGVTDIYKTPLGILREKVGIGDVIKQLFQMELVIQPFQKIITEFLRIEHA